ncbi:MAG: ascorbate-dependent monooxygenase [Singulisphaera sp.]
MASENETAHTAPIPTCRAEASRRPCRNRGRSSRRTETITFHEHVAPILWRHCAGCHRPGEVGPFSLLTYKDAAKRAGFLRDVTASREMPPFRAVHGYGDFHDVGRLSRRELAVLARWADDGAPEGDPAVGTEPPTFPEGWHLGTPDLVATMPEPFVVPADGRDVYRAFVLPLPLDRDTAVAAVEFRRGNRRVVHHARFYVDPTDECRRRDAAQAGPGFESFGGDILKLGLGAWVPGLIPRMPPPDVGKVVRKGSDLILLVHYHGTGKEEVDRSSVGLFFCKTPPARRTSTISLSSIKIDIPPGEARHRIALTAYMKADAHALSVLPHGHFLMREISLRATLPGGQVVPMLWIDDWDFNWQGQYHFARPVPLPKGTRLDVVAYYDNSAENPFNPHRPPRRVKLGWASTDEMLGCHVQVIAADDESQRVLDQATPFGL